MSEPRPVLDYTRVSDDASILCRRQDYPRAVNVLQRRRPDRRRWRLAFSHVAVAAGRSLDGARRSWLQAALREVVTTLDDRRLRGELVIDACALEATVDLGGVLPPWSARDLWRMAEGVGLPMEYIASVAPLPRAINAPIDTPRVILACRRTAAAHREVALKFSAALSPVAIVEEVTGSLDASSARALAAMRAQHDAAQRWRELGHRLFGAAPP